MLAARPPGLSRELPQIERCNMDFAGMLRHMNPRSRSHGSGEEPRVRAVRQPKETPVVRIRLSGRELGVRDAGWRSRYGSASAGFTYANAIASRLCNRIATSSAVSASGVSTV